VEKARGSNPGRKLWEEVTVIITVGGNLDVFPQTQGEEGSKNPTSHWTVKMKKGQTLTMMIRAPHRGKGGQMQAHYHQ